MCWLEKAFEQKGFVIFQSMSIHNINVEYPLTRQFASNEIVARAHQSNRLNSVQILNVRAQTTFSLDAAVSRDIA